MSSVLSFLKAITEVWGLLKGLMTLYKQAKREGWISEGKEITREINKAKTPEERRALAKRLAEHVR